jgi:hypothetical protein
VSRDEYRLAVDRLLEQIDEQRRRSLLLEAAGMQAPGLEEESERARQQLADLTR